MLTTPENVEDKDFDMITSMEVLEHVKEKELFVQSLSKLLRKDGHLFMSTIDRTLESYLKVIIGAEYITGIVPRDTHDWNLFITPYELQHLLEKHGLKVTNIQGVEFSLVEGTMKYSTNKMNYMLTAQKL